MQARAARRSTRGRRSRLARHAAVPRAARPARLHAPEVGGDRRRRARARHLPLLPWPWACRCASSTARPSWRGAYTMHRPDEVDFDTVGVRLRRRLRDAHRRARRRTASARSSAAHPRHVRRLLQERRRRPRRPARRLDAHRRCRLLQARHGHLVVIDRIKDIATTVGRRPLLAAVHREQAEVLALHRRGGGPRRRAAAIWPRSSASASRSSRNGRSSSRIAFTTYTDLAAPAGGATTCSRGEVEKVNATLPRGAAHPQVRAALQGARCRRRRADPHAQGAPRRHQREIRRHHRRRSTRGDRVQVDTAIAFQDGTKQRIRTDLPVVMPRSTPSARGASAAGSDSRSHG